MGWVAFFLLAVDVVLAMWLVGQGGKAVEVME